MKKTVTEDDESEKEKCIVDGKLTSIKYENRYLLSTSFTITCVENNLDGTGGKQVGCNGNVEKNNDD